MKTVTLHLYSDLVSRSGHRAVPLVCHENRGEGTSGKWLVDYICVELKTEMVVIIRNGHPVPSFDLASIDIDEGDEFHAAPRPGTGADVILVGIALLSAAGSAYLATQNKMPDVFPVGSGDSGGAERRYGFNRFSNQAIVGDVIPVIYGRRRRYGGKVVAQVPVESSDGSGNSAVRILINLGHGKIHAIGDQTADFDNLAHDEILGLFLNDQEIANFPGTRVWGRMGSSGQAVIPGFKDTQTLKEVGVGGVELRNTSGVFRSGGSASGEAFTFSTGTVNAARIRVRFPAGLYSVGASGQPDAQVAVYRYRTRMTAGPGAWSAWTNITLERADQSEFFSSPQIDGLAAGAGDGFDIQVERCSIESGSVAQIDTMKWDSVVEILYAENTYDRMAMLALEVIAGEQISGGVPRVSADIQGLECRVWDGVSPLSAPVFTEQYTENPAWHSLDYITDIRYGMGATYGGGSPAGADSIDLANLIEEAQICDEMVDRPVVGSGQRARYRFHFAFDQARDDIDILRTIGSAFRCTPYTVGGVWRFAADRLRTTPVEVFTDGSIAIDEQSNAPRASYRRELATGGMNRANQLTCTFENELADGRSDTIAYPQDGQYWLGGLTAEVANPKSIRLDGVTDPDQVMGELIFRMNKIRYLTRSLRIVTTKPVVIAQAQDRVDVAVGFAGYGLASGRCVSGSTTAAVKIDRSLILEAGKTYQIQVVHPDNSVEPRTITSPPGAYAIGAALAVDSAFAAAPEEFAEYSLGETGKALKPWNLTSVRVSEDLAWELELLEYNAGIYTLIPGPVDLPDYSSLPNPGTPPGPVLDLRAVERPINGIHSVQLSWSQTPADAQITSSFRIYRRRLGLSSWIRTPLSSVSYHTALIEISESDVAYEFAVVAVSYGGAALSPDDPRVPHVSVVTGLAGEPPPPPTGVLMTNTGDNTYTLSWDPVDGAVAYQVMTRGGSPVAIAAFGAGPRDCLTLQRVVAATSLAGLELPPTKTQYFWVRATLANGRMSYHASGISQLGATPAGESVKQDVTFDSSTVGDTKTNCGFVTVSGTQVLVQTSPASPAMWQPATQDSGALTLSELTILPTLWNYAADPLLSDDTMIFPSIPADQWGVVADSPDRVVGMLQPPYPDDEIGYVFEVRTHNGTTWSSWQEIKLCQSIKRTFRNWEIRVGLSRKHAPYRPGLKDLTVVITN